jgi:YidC/Oxa1 family membrane protein insertase
MEDQGKRLLLAVVIAFGLLWVWNMVFPTQPPKEQAPEPEPSTAVDRDTGVAPSAAEKPDAVEAVEQKPEEVVTFELGTIRVELSSHGAALKSWQLLEPQLEDRRVKPAVPLELAPTASKGSDFYPFQVWLGDDELEAMRTASWEIVERGEREVTFRWAAGGLELIKRYKIDEQHFLLDLEIDVVKQDAEKAEHELTVALFGFQDPEAEIGGGYTELPREWKAACLVGDEVKTKSAKDLIKESSRRDGDVRWGGFAHSYFVAAGAPEHSAEGRYECDAYAVDGYPGAMRVEVTYPEVTLEDGRYRRRLVAYYGPKRMGTLQAASHATGFAAGFEEAIDLGWLGFLSGPLLWLLTMFQSFVINWGIAIICLTVVVKLLVLPWTHKSIKSMKAMSNLRPQMEKLKEKYADDKQRQQVEMMNLFKAHGVNPLSGCLPMLLQMPIWFALYRMLMAAAELYQAPFIVGWIDDLTAPDPYYLLPILVTGMMFFQTRLTPTTATGMQQKLLMYGMPAMFGFFSLFFPAGLTLYIFTNTCLTLVHHFFVHREDRAKARAERLMKGKSSSEDGAASPDASSASAASKSETSGETGAPTARKSSNGSSGKKSKSRGKKGKKKKAGRK